MADWVTVVPITAAGRVVMIRQYRHGTGEIGLEIPGGVIDPGEEPLAAARRELREETGYGASELASIGQVAPNPALQDNRCYSFVARGAFCARAQALMGDDYWRYGIADNMKEIEAMTRYSFEQGLTARKLVPADLFAESTFELAKV